MARVRNCVIAAPQQSLEAAAELAHQAGVTPVILSDSLEGESREVGTVLAGIARQVRRHGQPAPPPCVMLSGGETTVTVRGTGCGGRNVELLLALALGLRGAAGTYAIACDTDGVDGAAEVAGALIGPDTLRRAEQLGVSAAAALADNDGHSFFAALGDQVVTGPTLTNVNDFRAVLIT
jgi:glycerate-2-kinase